MTIKDKKRVDDHYSRKARQEGYPARSVYKLEEIDAKYKLLKPEQRVLDLGCAPGSWTLYAAAKVGPGGRVLGLDLHPPETAFPPQVRLGRADLLAENLDWLEEEGSFDLVLSDMAPQTMGRREVDQARSLELCRMAWLQAEKWLKAGGHFLFKIFQSPDGDDFIRALKPRFEKITRLKPRATRGQSPEIFVLGQKFRRII
ncbi:MAG: RlmE family RNA methyltransferase [Candidatus Adiutrix sp.]|nr:RlmE family RNA methyltransferase [Candidatus Adiutrix sp.]